MFRWLPKKLHRRQQLFFQLAIFSFVVHASAFLAYIILSQSRAVTLNMRLAVIDQDTPIIVLPFVKNTQQIQRAQPIVARQQISHSKTHTQQSSRVVRKQAQTHQTRTRITTRSTPTKMVQKTTTHARTQTTQTVKQQITLKPTKNIKQAKMATPHSAIAKPTRTITKAERPHKPSEPSQPLQTISQYSPAAETQAEHTSASTTPEQDSVNTLFTPENITLSIAQTPAEQAAAPITLGREECRMLHVYQELHGGITTSWHPPADLNPHKECIIVVIVNEQAAPSSIIIEQSSGIRAYDIAARFAVYHSTFPPELKKQTVRLHF